MFVAALSMTVALAAFQTDLDDDDDLVADGFTSLEESPGRFSFSDGVLTIDSTGYAEWMLLEPNGQWWAHVRNRNGWWAQARMKTSPSNDPDCGGPGLWIAEARRSPG